MDDKRKDGSDDAEAEELEEKDGTRSSDTTKRVTDPPSRSPARNEDEDEDDDDEDDDEDDDDDEEEQPPKKAVPVKQATKAPAKAGPVKKATKPVVKLPSELPLPPRNNEIVTGLVVAIAGYLAFWFGWSVYSTSIEKRHIGFFSNSAWAFLIAYFLVVVAAVIFVRRERRDPKDKSGAEPKIDRLGVLLAGLVCGPFYAVYWWKAYEIWKTMYAGARPVMWTIYVAAFALMTWGVVYALRPPSEQEELNRRIPGRRILLMLMTPFAIVYGMIYLAGIHPPWP
jgi:heme/copper-type cytochrome/quinol oxidase subunit 2